jgi:hypothetical protein
MSAQSDSPSGLAPQNSSSNAMHVTQAGPLPPLPVLLRQVLPQPPLGRMALFHLLPILRLAFLYSSFIIQNHLISTSIQNLIIFIIRPLASYSNTVL